MGVTHIDIVSKELLYSGVLIPSFVDKTGFPSMLPRGMRKYLSVEKGRKCIAYEQM